MEAPVSPYFSNTYDFAIFVELIDIDWHDPCTVITRTR